MSNHQNNGIGNRTISINLDESPESPMPESPPQLPTMVDAANAESQTRPNSVPVSGFATRAGISDGPNKNKLVILASGLLVAVLFFVFTAIVGKSHTKSSTGRQSGQPTKQEKPNQSKGSVTPLMEAASKVSPEDGAGQLHPSDIRGTRSSAGGIVGKSGSETPKPDVPRSPVATSLESIPSFSDTQQKWEEPPPYGTASSVPMSQTQQQISLKESSSVIFVRGVVQDQGSVNLKRDLDNNDGPLLEMTPGTRIQAKLETQISSAVQAPVVAVVEYTYAIGDRIIVPAGARVYGQLKQADRSGLVSLQFDEIELLDGAKEKIDAIGTGLDLGPIKGQVFGKNTGKNLFVRSVSGIGSVLAEVAGNNGGAAFSEDDMLRERLAENIGTAGDSEVMSLNANTRVVVSVPADTKIYIVFTKHEQSLSTLHKVSAGTP